MTEEQKKDVVYIIFIITLIILAVLYFSVPERTAFFENQLRWWKELQETLLGLLR